MAGAAGDSTIATNEFSNRRRLIALSSLIVTAVTIVVMLVATEIILRRYIKEPYMFERRLMFFSEGHNFQNKPWGGFAYEPHAKLHVATYYLRTLKPAQAALEYEYRFTTNALGRVQRTEPDSTKSGILFLGDSFTEGQGAEPWFYKLEADWPRTSPYQLISGAVLGTGVEDWVRLYFDLSTKLQITKAVVIFIGDDWHRPVWQFPQQTLACLNLSTHCTGGENFYGWPADSAMANAQIDRIARYRAQQLTEIEDTIPWRRRTAIYRKLWKPMKLVINHALGRPAADDAERAQFEVSKRVVKSMVQKLGRDNVLFIYLPQHQELGPGPDAYSRAANNFIRESGYALVDGRQQCGLTVSDYHPHDGHPNANGYTKIEACVERATTAAMRSNGDAEARGQ